METVETVETEVETVCVEKVQKLFCPGKWRRWDREGEGVQKVE